MATVQALLPQALDFLHQSDASTILDFAALNHEVNDPESCSKPIHPFDADALAHSFPEHIPDGRPQAQPVEPDSFKSDGYGYLQPTLTRNEYLRLSTLWYHARNAFQKEEFMANLQTKIEIVKDMLGWDSALFGLIDMDQFARFVSAGLGAGLIPRRESICSHTIQGEGSGYIFQSPDLSKDWRFKGMPAVAKGGLRSYAGTPLRCQVENGDSVAIGTLCVASDKPGKALSPAQSKTLSKFADMVMSEIVAQSHAVRREQQQRMNELLTSVTVLTDIDQMELRAMAILKEVYPNATITLQDVSGSGFHLPGGRPLLLEDAKRGVWEDTPAIEAIIQNENQRKPTGSDILRAIISVLRLRPAEKVLVVATSELRQIFDHIDTWFVERCGAILTTIIQERSLIDARLAKERFLRGITHQLRTPIHGVLGSVDLLVEDLSARNLLNPQTPGIEVTDYLAKELGSATGSASNVNTAEVLRTIQNSGRELMSTVNNILRLNKWAELLAQLENSAVYDLRNLEEDLLAETRKVLPEMHAERLVVYFDNRLPANISTTTLNIDLVKECLYAVLLNALLFTQSGHVVFTTSCPADLSTIVFDIRDSGKGIKPENHARVFEDYEKEDQHTRGVGLGLTIASKIGAAMSGNVALVSSAPGEGSHFRLTFPKPGLAGPVENGHAPRAFPTCENFTTFSLLSSQPLNGHLEHFTGLLERSGLSHSSVTLGGLTIAAYDADAVSFAQNLQDARLIDGTVVCLVPPTARAARLRQQHPGINFYEGPFTTRRLTRMMAELNNIAQARRPSYGLAAMQTPPRKDSDVHTPASPELSMDFENKLDLKRAYSRRNTRPHALLVDDNVINLRIIRMWCDKRSHPYRLAMDGFQAVAQYEESLAEGKPISLVLLDLQMPNCDGIEACMAIRNIEKSLGVDPAVIFIITGQDDPKDRRRALQAGADEFYVKPMGLKLLDQATAMYFDMAAA